MQPDQIDRLVAIGALHDQARRTGRVVAAQSRDEAARGPRAVGRRDVTVRVARVVTCSTGLVARGDGGHDRRSL